jgi:hypothetical protein
MEQEFENQENKERPAYTEWLLSLKQKTQLAEREEEQEHEWRQRYKT